MTLRDTILADSAAIVHDTVNGAAEPFGWYHGEQAGIEITGVPEVRAGAFEPDDYGVEDPSVTIWYATADVALMTHGDVIIWRAKAYRVRALEPNDWGLTAARLVEASDLLVEQYQFPGD